MNNDAVKKCARAMIKKTLVEHKASAIRDAKDELRRARFHLSRGTYQCATQAITNASFWEGYRAALDAIERSSLWD